ncbi:MAG: hypothetical protein EZS28_034209, partial [Streblomastix strix]
IIDTVRCYEVDIVTIWGILSVTVISRSLANTLVSHPFAFLSSISGQLGVMLRPAPSRMCVINACAFQPLACVMVRFLIFILADPQGWAAQRSTQSQRPI